MVGINGYSSEFKEIGFRHGELTQIEKSKDRTLTIAIKSEGGPEICLVFSQEELKEIVEIINNPKPSYKTQSFFTKLYKKEEKV